MAREVHVFIDETVGQPLRVVGARSDQYRRCVQAGNVMEKDCRGLELWTCWPTSGSTEGLFLFAMARRALRLPGQHGLFPGDVLQAGSVRIAHHPRLVLLGIVGLLARELMCRAGFPVRVDRDTDVQMAA